MIPLSRIGSDVIERSHSSDCQVRADSTSSGGSASRGRLSDQMPGDGSGGSRSSCSRQAGTGRVDRDADGREPAGLGARDEVPGQLPVREPVQLEPRLRHRRPDVLEPDARPGAHDHRRAERLGRAGGRQLGVGMRESVEGGRREQDRQRDRPAEDGHRGVDVADVDERALPEPPARVRLEVAARRLAGPGRTGDEVVALGRHALPREGLELLHREDPRQLLRFEIGRPSAHLVDHVPTSLCVSQPASCT